MQDQELLVKETSTRPFPCWSVVKRNGLVVLFQKERITKALESAFRDTKKLGKDSVLPSDIREAILEVEEKVLFMLEQQAGSSLTVEGIQDIVECQLMACGHHEVAKDYILYRENHKILREGSPQQLKILRRDMKRYVQFKPLKIAYGIEKRFRNSLHIHDLTPEKLIEATNHMTQEIVEAAVQRAHNKEPLYIEWVEEEIEKQLMKHGHYQVAKDYILERAQRQESIEEEEEETDKEIDAESVTIMKKDGSFYQLSNKKLAKKINFACEGLANVKPEAIFKQTMTYLYNEMKQEELLIAPIMATRSFLEQAVEYTYVAARLLLDTLYEETLGVEADHPQLKKIYKNHFKETIRQAVAHNQVDPAVLSFDLDKLAEALDPSRDHLFTFLGLQTLYDRYFLKQDQARIETPQTFWMRIAIGLSLKEGARKTEYAIEFYNIISTFRFIPSTPTLFNAATLRQQLSSCYLSTISDDLSHIFKVISDDAQLSKWAGGIGNDWTYVRATGARIKGTKGKSQGIIPFLKVANDTAVAVNQGGKRKGAMCAYLETWHLDIEEFLELRKNTGDERRRTHDMNTANWIPDLFMKRVLAGETWTLFSPDEVPDLHDLYGKAFEKRYVAYEKLAQQGKISLYKQVDALTLWRKMLGMLYETGHPWITFKDPSNIRSPQSHVGVIHCSNLCTEITLNNSSEETAVCNLGSINLVTHMTSQGLDEAQLSHTIKYAVRMLDNVIDLNFYPTKEARKANLLHRPIGLGLMGFQDALYHLKISYASHEAVLFADRCMELISYHAILASTQLAQERGTYSSYKGSKWYQGILPLDTIELLKQERGEEFVEIDQTATLDWSVVRHAIATHGMRNSNCMAIAPTATIANIVGVSASIEPAYKHLYVKSNLSGEFTVLNPYLVRALQQEGLWDEEMIDDLKYFDGSILEIARIPDHIKQCFLTAFEIDPSWIIESACRRQKWIDMAQSLNLYLAQANGKKLHEMYVSCWKKLKTTYYLRTTSATQIEKSTTDINKRGLQPRWMKNASPSSRISVKREKVCDLSEGCESCQ